MDYFKAEFHLRAEGLASNEEIRQQNKQQPGHDNEPGETVPIEQSSKTKNGGPRDNLKGPATLENNSQENKGDQNDEQHGWQHSQRNE